MSLQKQNVNDIYFDGVYKDIWKSLIPEKLTQAEVDFFVQEFALQKGARILDIMCGYGRHAIALARKGFDITAVDNLGSYINEIAATAEKENLSINYKQQDVLQFDADGNFDLAICMGNSLSFFNEDDTLFLLQKISNQLKPGGSLVINTWCIAEIAIPKFVAQGKGTTGNTEVITESQYLFNPTRIETTNTFITGDGQTEIKKAIDYIFSFAELQHMLGKAGFTVKTAYSIPGKKLFSFGEPRLYLVAEKGSLHTLAK